MKNPETMVLDDERQSEWVSEWGTFDEFHFGAVTSRFRVIESLILNAV